MFRWRLRSSFHRPINCHKMRRRLGPLNSAVSTGASHTWLVAVANKLFEVKAPWTDNEKKKKAFYNWKWVRQASQLLPKQIPVNLILFGSFSLTPVVTSFHFSLIHITSFERFCLANNVSSYIVNSCQKCMLVCGENIILILKIHLVIQLLRDFCHMCEKSI